MYGMHVSTNFEMEMMLRVVVTVVFPSGSWIAVMK